MSRKPRETSRTGEGRQKRVPLGLQTAKLARKASPGMVGRFVNDEGGRIAAAQAAGYEHVMVTTGLDGEERRDSEIVGVQTNGQPLIAFYMEIPIKFYREDQKAKQEQVDLVDEAISGGNIEGAVGQDGRYVPDGGIKVRRG